MTTTKRFLGIDYGSKRVGIALSDEAGKFALPLCVIHNSDLLVTEIHKILIDNQIGDIILGESRDYKGQPNAIFPQILDLKSSLEKLGYRVIFEQEFMTSQQAERFTGKNDMSDASAAALILQSYLDRERL
jgi:putative Holliday junction resolvase